MRECHDAYAPSFFQFTWSNFNINYIFCLSILFFAYAPGGACGGVTRWRIEDRSLSVPKMVVVRQNEKRSSVNDVYQIRFRQLRRENPDLFSLSSLCLFSLLKSAFFLTNSMNPELQKHGLFIWSRPMAEREEEEGGTRCTRLREPRRLFALHELRCFSCVHFIDWVSHLSMYSSYIVIKVSQYVTRIL